MLLHSRATVVTWVSVVFFGFVNMGPYGRKTSNDISSDFWRPCIFETACRRTKQTKSLASRVSILYIESSSWLLSDQVQFGLFSPILILGDLISRNPLVVEPKTLGSFAAFPGFDDFAFDLNFQVYFYWEVYTFPVFFYLANDQAECQGPWVSFCCLQLAS